MKILKIVLVIVCAVASLAFIGFMMAYSDGYIQSAVLDRLVAVLFPAFFIAFGSAALVVPFWVAVFGGEMSCLGIVTTFLLVFSTTILFVLFAPEVLFAPALLIWGGVFLFSFIFFLIWKKINKIK